MSKKVGNITSCEVKSNVTINYIKIYIDDILHISIPKDTKIKIQSWREDKSLYKIEIRCANHSDEYHYDNRQLWIDILNELDFNID